MPLEAIVLSVGKKAGAQAMRQLLGLEEQIPALRRKIDILLQGDYLKGTEWLEEASRAADERERDERLDKARDRFVDARGLLRDDPLVRSAAALKIAQIDEYRGRNTAARESARKAFEDAVAATKQSCAQVDRLLDIGRAAQAETPHIKNFTTASLLVAAAAGLLVFALATTAAGPIVGVLVGGAAWMGSAVIVALLFMGGSKAAVKYKGKPIVHEIEERDAYVKNLVAYRVALGERRVSIPEHAVIEKNARGQATFRYELVHTGAPSTTT